MKDLLNHPCHCGSGKKFSHCCLFKNQKMEKHDPFLEYDTPDYTGVVIYHGFDKKYAKMNPFQIDFDNACCYVLQANKYLADQHNHMLQFKILKPGEWFVMGDQDGQTKYSFKYRSAEEAMDIAKDKFSAERFLQQPQFI